MDLSGIINYLVPINLIFTIWLTFKQVAIDNQNLRLNLYEKRYCIYETTVDFLRDFLRVSLSGDFQDKMSDMLYEYKHNVHQSIFLFDDEMEKYLLKIYNCAESVYIKKQQVQDCIAEIKWLEEQKVEARKMFKPYMKFNKQRWLGI